jgi:hypothetical protein
MKPVRKTLPIRFRMEIRTGLCGNATGLWTVPFQISDIEKSSSRDWRQKFAAFGTRCPTFFARDRARRPPGHCGASVVAAPIAVATEWRIP